MKKTEIGFWSKVSAFILLVICMVIAVFSSVVIAINAEWQWYSMDEDAVQRDINETVIYASFDLIYEEYNRIMAYDSTLMNENAEFIKGEKESNGFGYLIRKTGDNGSVVLRQINPDIKDKEGVMSRTMEHDDIIIEVYLGDIGNKENTVPLDVYYQYSQYEILYKYRMGAVAAGTVSLIIAVVMFVFLAASVGRKKDDASIVRNVPVELIFIVSIFMIAVTFFISASIYELGTDFYAVLIAVGTIVLTTTVAGTLLIFISKLRQGTLWKSSILHYILRGIKKIGRVIMYGFKSMLIVWKITIIVTVCLIINLIITVNSVYWGVGMLPWFIGAVVIEFLAIYMARGLKKLKEGGKHLAEGDLDYQIDKDGLMLDFAEHADNLNSIGQGMQTAVEEKMKSERFKTELITNVSHDIKTPLTSIINYVDFLKKEEFDNDKAREYIDVLDRQSHRLKKLTEDLVELSKAATGNIKINMEPCNVGIMMTQVMGEYKEKAEKEDLKLMLDVPEEAMEIMADGRNLWRVFDNLLNNICKYSQPGTRVYQTLEKCDGRAVITYKNTSRYELNMSADELMERFVRGDSSRHTEGSGLGLSIAKNLVELQGGNFDITIDGDLFKVIIDFKINI